MEVWNLIWPNTRNAKFWLPHQQNNKKFFAMFLKNITNLKTIPRNFSVSEKTEANSTHRRTVASKKSSSLKIEQLFSFGRRSLLDRHFVNFTLPQLFCRAVFSVTPFQPFLSTLNFLNIQNGVCSSVCCVGRE